MQFKKTLRRKGIHKSTPKVGLRKVAIKPPKMPKLPKRKMYG